MECLFENENVNQMLDIFTITVVVHVRRNGTGRQQIKPSINFVCNIKFSTTVIFRLYSYNCTLYGNKKKNLVI